MKKISKKVFYAGVLMALAPLNFSCDRAAIDGLNELIADQCDETWTETVKPEVDALNEAGIAYNSDASTANCQNLRTAQANYLEALEDVRECVDNFNRSSYDAALNEIKAGIEEFDCSE